MVLAFLGRRPSHNVYHAALSSAALPPFTYHSSNTTIIVDWIIKRPALNTRNKMKQQQRENESRFASTTSKSPHKINSNNKKGSKRSEGDFSVWC
jgi:hypothetical protein